MGGPHRARIAVARAVHPGLRRAREAAGGAHQGVAVAATEADAAAKLIERLLADPAFRARFRRNPAEACREAGLDELADEMSLASGGAMHTLDLRESRSSLAGVMMAAAMEGIGVYEFTKHIAPAFEGVPEAVNDVLSRVHLPTIPGRGALAGAGPPPAPPVEPT